MIVNLIFYYNGQSAAKNFLIFLYYRRIMSDTRRRKNYLTEQQCIPLIYFDDRPIELLSFIETKPVDIDGIAKDYYYANNQGELFNKYGKFIKPIKINSGYYKYNLQSDSDKPSKNILSHRLFMKIFCPIDDNSNMTVNHINGVKSDNRIDNLEWVSQKENNDKKEQLFPNYGSYNYHAAFNYSQLETIIELLDNNVKYKDILSAIGMEINDNNMDYIGNIKRGKTYKKEVEKIRKLRFND